MNVEASRREVLGMQGLIMMSTCLISGVGLGMENA